MTTNKGKTRVIMMRDRYSSYIEKIKINKNLKKKFMKNMVERKEKKKRKKKESKESRKKWMKGFL